MILTIHTKPNARETKVVMRLDESTLVVAIAAPAKEGKANKALVGLLAEEYGVAKSRVQIIRGATTRIKHVEVVL
jgi:hypothetical protein